MTLRLPEPSYAHVDGDAIAWYSIGDRPETLVGCPGMFLSVESIVESPGAVRLIERLAEFRRVVLFDHRSSGVSDPFSADRDPTTADWIDDITAVIDASGRGSVDLFGIGVATLSVIAAAAAIPERVRTLTLICGCPKIVAADDYPQGMTDEMFAGWQAAVEGGLGAPEMEDRVLPSTGEDARTFLRRSGRHGSRPRAARRLLSALADTDVRADLARVACPTLIIHAEDDSFIRADCGRLMAETVASSRLELLPTGDHVVAITMPDEVASLAESFLTGREATPVLERRLLAVLSSDIVESTRRAAAMGDAAWRSVMAELDRSTRALVERAGGTVVKFTGDGHLATFDRPGDAVLSSRGLSARARALDVPVRIGVHFGEVEILDGDVLGLAVVLATRVMALGGPDETIATSTVVDLVEGAGHRWTTIGSHPLKGIDRPRELWRLADDPRADVIPDSPGV